MTLGTFVHSLAALAMRFAIIPIIPHEIPNDPCEFLTNSALNPLRIFPEILANSPTNHTTSPVIPYGFLANVDGSPQEFH